MCGLTGFLTAFSIIGMEHAFEQMIAAITHRGPDDVGSFIESGAGLALGHRRLAIIDLSAAGHQPMNSVSGRYVMVYNGEVYNHLEIRAELDTLRRDAISRSDPCIREKEAGAGMEDIVGAAWRGHSDTETLLAAFEYWGVEPTLKRCVGMFAIALWDRQTRSLTLVRDRFGEKPLYYGWVGHGPQRAFVFGSELKALEAYPGFDAPVCRKALAQYLRFLYVPAPHSIFEGIYKLEPGCLLTVQGTPPTDAPLHPMRPGQEHGSVTMRCWWSLAEAVEASAHRSIDNDAEALRCLEDALLESVSLQSLADVPLGAFLSGGVDSSTIVALMQRQSSRPVKTFTIGFDEAGYDESSHALAVAQHLGTEHHEIRVCAKMAQDVIPRLPHLYDEPFADSSQIPTYLVCKAARQHVTVALSGDGADELFGGYNRHVWGPAIWRNFGALPYTMREGFSAALNWVPAAAANALSRHLGVVRAGEKARKLGRALHGTRSAADLYRNLVSEWQDPASLVLDLEGSRLMAPTIPQHSAVPAAASSTALQMMYLDSISYLPDDILCKVDRAAMGVSLETRVPFLDHRVAELSWRLPLRMKIRGNRGKWILRELLYKYVPRELVERPKAGFAVPVGAWLRGPLRDWAEYHLSDSKIRDEGFFDPLPIRKLWMSHLSGRSDHTASLWAVLIFQSWLDHHRPKL